MVTFGKVKALQGGDIRKIRTIIGTSLYICLSTHPPILNPVSEIDQVHGRYNKKRKVYADYQMNSAKSLHCAGNK